MISHFAESLVLRISYLVWEFSRSLLLHNFQVPLFITRLHSLICKQIHIAIGKFPDSFLIIFISIVPEASLIAVLSTEIIQSLQCFFTSFSTIHLKLSKTCQLIFIQIWFSYFCKLEVIKKSDSGSWNFRRRFYIFWDHSVIFQ